ncbi:unnamed protein product [Phytophthora fragariaefolia]|uniref:Unnamed protein product n=1 Tax=Phytophthora fragariaefolia TaxID=1490495 RepID=A0A9W7D168_9STRA|nr:unnamed protein product [Phytophthora fragariaefolia]
MSSICSDIPPTQAVADRRGRFHNKTKCRVRESKLGNGRTQWRHYVPIPQNTMSSTSESGAGSAGPSAYHVMEKDLKPWELYDLSGAEGPVNLAAMKENFTRYR